jgi:hypothetical protein
MGKFQNVNFEKPMVLKVAHDCNNNKMYLWRSINRYRSSKETN